MSEKPHISQEKTKEMQERARERSLILKEIKSIGPSTIDELAKVTGMEKPLILKNLIAMRQFGKILVVGERDNELVYGLQEEQKS